MKLTKATPMATTLRPEMDRLFERFFGPFEMPEVKVFETAWVPTIDLSETGTEYVVRLEAPGIPKENLDVSLDANVLTLSGRRESRKEETGEEYIWREREEGKFLRTIRLPVAVMGEKVAATYEDGVLVVRIPKAQPTVKSKITIK
jgi:HSP20 family protein